MKKKTVIILSVFFCLIIFIIIQMIDIDKILCGDLEKCRKDKLDIANAKYRNIVTIEYIPCESSYLNVIINQNLDDTLYTLNEIHNILYDKETGCGWMSIKVFNNDREFIYDHLESGTINKIETNW